MAGCLDLLPPPLLLAIILGGGTGAVWSQGGGSLSDPTRPPMLTIEPVTGGSESTPPPSGLQTIILGKGHKPIAVINGVTVALGDKVGDATLVKLNESEAVLQGPAGREVLRLLPGIGKGADGLKRSPGVVVERRDDGSSGKNRKPPDSTK